MAGLFWWVKGTRSGEWDASLSPTHHFVLLTLSEAESFLPVEGAQVLGFDEVETDFVHLVEEFYDLGVAGRLVFGESASPVVGALGFWQSFGPDLDAPVGDHREFEILGGAVGEDSGEELGGAFVVDEDINADGLLDPVRLGRFGNDDRGSGPGVVCFAELGRRLSKSLDDGVGERLGAYFLFTVPFSVDVARVNSIF